MSDDLEHDVYDDGGDPFDHRQEIDDDWSRPSAPPSAPWGALAAALVPLVFAIAVRLTDTAWTTRAFGLVAGGPLVALAVAVHRRQTEHWVTDHGRSRRRWDVPASVLLLLAGMAAYTANAFTVAWHLAAELT
jgi:hypothetical protein